MQKQLGAPPLILGAGGFGRQLADWLAAEGYGEAEFLDDNALSGAGFTVLGKLADYEQYAVQHQPRAAFVGLGNNALRCELLEKLRAAGYDTPVFISAKAAVSPSAALGAGTVVLPFAYVGAGAVVGAGCILNAGAVVDHNTRLGAGVHVAPGGIVKAGAMVDDFAKVDSGEIIRSPWEK